MQEIVEEHNIKHNATSEKQRRFAENVIAIILFYAMINSMAACLFEFNAQLARVARYGLYIIESALIGYALLLSLQRIPRMIIAAYCATAAIFLLTVCFYPQTGLLYWNIPSICLFSAFHASSCLVLSGQNPTFLKH